MITIYLKQTENSYGKIAFFVFQVDLLDEYENLKEFREALHYSMIAEFVEIIKTQKSTHIAIRFDLDVKASQASYLSNKIWFDGTTTFLFGPDDRKAPMLPTVSFIISDLTTSETFGRVWQRPML